MKKGERSRQILDFISANPDCTIDEIARHCQEPSSTIKKTIQNLEKEGKIKSKENLGKNSWRRPYKFYRYSLRR